MSDLAFTRVGASPPPRLRESLTIRLPDTELHALVVLPDADTCIVSAENDGTLHVLSLREGRVTRALAGHGGPVNSLALAGAGRLLLSASDDETIRVWDTATWRVTAVLEGHRGYIRDVAGHGLVAVSAGEDGTVRVWDLLQGVCRGAFDDHGCSVDAVAVSPDGRRAASIGRDNCVLLWDLVEPRLHRELYRSGQFLYDMPDLPVFGPTYLLLGGNDSAVSHEDTPNAMAFDPASGLLYTAEKELICWEPADGSEVARFPLAQSPADALAFDPARPLLATTSLLGVRVTSLEGEHVTSLGLGTRNAVDVCYLPDGRLLSAHRDGAARMWPVVPAEEREASRHSVPVSTLTIDPTGRHAATTGWNEAVMLWDLATGRRVAVGALDSLAHDPVFTPDGQHLVVPVGSTLQVHAMSGGPPRTLAPAGAHGRLIVGVTALDDASVAVSLHTEPPEIWRLDRSGQRMLSGEAGTGHGAVVLTPDGRHALALRSLDADHPFIRATAGAAMVNPRGIPALLCWDLTDGRLAWATHGAPTAGATGPCHRWLVLSAAGPAVTPVGYGANAVLRFLDVGTGEVLREVPWFVGIEQVPRALPDGTLLLVGHDAGGVTVSRLAPETAAPEPISRVPAGRIRLVPERDLLLRLQDRSLHGHRLSTGDELAMHPLPAKTFLFEVTPDGSTVLLGDQDGTVHILRMLESAT